MISFILQLIKGISFIKILVGLVLVLGVALAITWNSKEGYKEESAVNNYNYQSMVNLKAEADKDIDRANSLILENTEDMAAQLATIEGLEKLVKENDIKLKRARRIIAQQTIYKDTTKQSIDVSPIIIKIRDSIETVQQWATSAGCIKIRGELVYANNTLTNTILETEYIESRLIVDTWVRDPKTWFARTFGLGRKKLTLIAVSSCGNTETIIIDRKSKGKKEILLN